VASDAAFESSPDHLYFLAIEKVFIALRGSPLALSPTDWQVARGWHEAGMPLDWIEQTLRDIFAKRLARGTESKMTGLKFCRRSVEAAWKRRHQLHAAATVAVASEIDVGARLAALAVALPSALPGRGELERRIRALEGDAETIEGALAGLDREILLRAEETLTPEEQQAIAAEVEAALGKLRHRLGEEQLRGAYSELREKLLRDRLELPLLSLFAPEATGE
jgi:hypothetical protein